MNLFSKHISNMQPNKIEGKGKRQKEYTDGGSKGKSRQHLKPLPTCGQERWLDWFASQ